MSIEDQAKQVVETLRKKPDLYRAVQEKLLVERKEKHIKVLMDMLFPKASDVPGVARVLANLGDADIIFLIKQAESSHTNQGLEDILEDRRQEWNKRPALGHFEDVTGWDKP